jgi:intracellular sulfur oxidation DsrE/DsrF family protein
MHIADDTLPRRGFLERLTAAALPLAALTLGAGPRRAGAEGVTPDTRNAEGATGQPRVHPPDETWLRGLTGKHKTVFDVEAHKNGHALAQAKNLLDAYEQAYGVPPREVNLVLGVRGTGLPLVLADDLWARYRLGEQYGIADPASKAPSARNVFAAGNVQPDGPVTAEQTVQALQRRGALFLVCNNTVNGAARKLAGAGLGSPDAIRKDILAGILPGVVLVPAMVIAFGRMQERGVSYVYAG